MKKIKFLAIAFLVLLGNHLSAQVDVEEKAKDKANSRIERNTDEGIEQGLDAVEGGVKGLFKKKSKKSENDQSVENVQSEDQKEVKQVQKQTPALASSTKYDFVPGDKLLLFDDFSQDAIGDFPALWTTNGSGEVRNINLYPGNWFYLNAHDKVYNLAKDLTLPENYILEFDVVPTTEEGSGQFYLTLYRADGEFLNNELYPGTSGIHLTMSTDGWHVTPYAENSEFTDGSSELAPVELNQLNHVIVSIQKARIRVYHKGQKVVDMPTSVPVKERFNRFRVSLWGSDGMPYISNVRFTTAAPDTRSKLLTEGKLVSYGIYFDVNSDKVKPESYGAMNDIAKVLKENPNVRIKIVGHTDADGDASKNLDLSKRRAASVKDEFVKTFGIDGSRIETDGKGKTEPVAPNDTPANKAQNRRVEFIKL